LPLLHLGQQSSIVFFFFPSSPQEKLLVVLPSNNSPDLCLLPYASTPSPSFARLKWLHMNFFSFLQFCSTCTSQNLIAFACQFIFLCFCHSSSFSSKQAPAKEQTRDQARGLMGILINDNK
jgi:hypothetical protein